jgi:thiamine biosynthesis lipoprotein
MIRSYYTTFRAMGSQFQIWLETGLDGAAILQDVPIWVEDIESWMSRFRETSELSRVNVRSGLRTPVSEGMLDVLLAALDAARYTQGLYTPLILPSLLATGYDRSFELLERRQSTDVAQQFAIAVPDWRDIDVFVDECAVLLPAGAQLDFGGIGKGWTAEYIADRLEPYGACLVDAGGDIVARGRPQDQPGWQVLVADPCAENQTLMTLLLNNQAVATSGIDHRRWQIDGRRYHHLIDPRSGSPASTDVLSATVINADAERAEAYAKVLVILGSDAGLQWFADYGTGSALVVLKDGTVLATNNINDLHVANRDEVLLTKE